jgi:nitrogen fixation NifU-like protein
MTRPEAPTPELEALFHDLILDHYRRPRNKGELAGATARGAVVNPTCGDEIAVEVVVDGELVRAVRFTGRGCSISQASASMMTSAAAGRTREELRKTASDFGAMLRGETIDADRLGDLRALGGVARFPARVPCALMAWRALDAALTRADGD